MGSKKKKAKKKSKSPGNAIQNSDKWAEHWKKTETKYVSCSFLNYTSPVLGSYNFSPRKQRTGPFGFLLSLSSLLKMAVGVIF
jgi:hypothetical protein